MVTDALCTAAFAAFLRLASVVIQPPAQRAGQDQRPEAVRQRVCDGVAACPCRPFPGIDAHGYARRDCTGIRVEVADEQIRRQTELGSQA